MGLSKERGLYFQEKWEEMEYRFANIEMKKEIERLNNIINELEKYFFGQLQMYGGGGIVQEYYDKLQELKGSDKE